MLPIIGFAASMAVTEQQIGSGRLEVTKPNRSSQGTQRIVKADGFMYENFESVPDGETSLPEGWIAVATPGSPDDTWHAGTLGRDGTPLNGVSGFKYAYILGNRDGNGGHDAWLFSPGLEMEAGTEYTIEFFALMPPVTGDDIMEKLQVNVCSGTTPADVVTEFEVIENDNDYWRYYRYTYTPTAAGTYHIGFHSLSPANSNSTVIDDLKISSGPMPVFSGKTDLNLGTTDTRKKNLSGTYRISNDGQAALDVSLESASEGVTVEGLPLTVAADGSENFSISASCITGGDYSGYVTLKTNDPTHPTVRIDLSGEVKEARVTGYNFEDFETGGPEGWDLSFGSANVALYGGHNSTRAYYTTSVYWDDSRNEELGGVGFTTHYVEMGDAPEVSFWYQFAKVDFSGNVTGAAQTSEVSVKVLMTDDDGATYKTIYSIEPGGEHEFESSLDWQQVVVPVSEYAGKTCRLRVVFNQLGGVSFFNQMRIMADDVEIGTKVANDLRATSLTGNALLTSGRKAEFVSTIENLGSETMSDYKVELVNAADNSVLYVADGVPVEAGKKNTVKLEWTPSASGKVTLNARIVSESDPDAGNNTSYTHYAEVLPADNSVLRIAHGEALAAMTFPVNYYAVEAATQSIYKANEIGVTRGDINSIVFTSTLDADFYGEPFSVYIGETFDSDFSSGEFISPESLTKVFEGAIYMQSGTRDFVIPFDNTYSYKGGNIVVMCEKLGKEFVLGKYFVVHKCDDLRSIQTTTFKAGTIAENGYTDASAETIYPEIRFNLVKADAGIVTGVVTDENGPVENAMVKVKGTSRSEMTDAQGRFTFSEVAAGDCELEVSKHSYYTHTDSKFTLAKGQTANRNITITKLPRYVVSGKITSKESGEPIKDAKVALKGYDDFAVFTDSHGCYSIESVAGDCGSDYSLIVTDGYFKDAKSQIDVDGNKTADFALEEKQLRAHNAKALSTNNGVVVTWDAPMPEFRYDSGEPVDYIGWTHGNSEVIVGAAFHKKARIKEISWYVTDRYGAHSGFNVFIFGLDEEGNPNAKDLLYVARNVENTDNAWSTHILNTPVEADGFMIAVSCTGFMGMGICEPTEEYPFNEGECYYAGDSYNMNISNMSTFAKVHPMLRAYGEDLDTQNTGQSDSSEGDAIERPATEYKVYRGAQGSTENEWTLLGSTKSVDWFDTTPADVPSYYAIVASYASGKADAVRSNIIKFSSLSSIIDGGVSIKMNNAAGTLTITGSEAVENLTLLSDKGMTMLSIDNPESTVDVAALPSGIYFAKVTLKDHNVHIEKLIK